MNALHTHFLEATGDLATVEKYLEKAKRGRSDKSAGESGLIIPLRSQKIQSALRLGLSRFALLGTDKERIRKREICLSLLNRRIG